MITWATTCEQGKYREVKESPLERQSAIPIRFINSVIYLEDSLVKRNREFVEWTRGKTGKQTEPNRESAHGVMR
jgi:hypothetical protein